MSELDEALARLEGGRIGNKMVIDKLKLLAQLRQNPGALCYGKLVVRHGTLNMFALLYILL